MMSDNLSVIFAGRGKNTGSLELVIRALDRNNHAYKEIRLGDDTGIYFFNNICLIKTVSLTGIRNVRGIIVLSDNIQFNEIKDITGELIGITGSDNTSGLEFLGNNSLPTITCGSGSKDTMTYSSLTDDSITVSLQRSITSINKKIITPSEYYLKYNNIPPDEILKASAVLLLLDIPVDNMLSDIF